MSGDHVYQPSNCNTCKNFIHLTPDELNILQPKLDALWAEIGPVKGLCTRSRNHPRALANYIFGDEGNCELYERGFYREKMGIACPACKKGELAISHLPINGKQVILFGCYRYPDCRFSIRQVRLQTMCRYCGVPLMLTSGDLIRCACPKCHRTLALPGLLRAWPELVKPRQGCMHTPPSESCQSCDQSRRQRVSLLEMEMPALVKWQVGQRKMKSAAHDYDEDVPNQYDSPYLLEEDDERELELGEDRYKAIEDWEELIEELDEFGDGTAFN